MTIHREPEISQTASLFRNWYVSPAGGPRGAGLIRDSKGPPENPRVLGRYALVYLVRGGGTYRDPTGVRSMDPGDFVLVYPEVPHWYGPEPGGRWDEFYLVFEGPIFDAWRRAGLFDVPQERLRLHPVRYWLTRLVSSVGSGNRGDPDNALRELIDLQVLLCNVLTHVRSDHSARDWVDKARDLLDSGLDERATARALGDSYDTFRRRFSRLSGMPPGRYRSARTMEAACELLVASDRTIGSVARQLGFYDEFHFSRRFKEIVGQTPSEFRQSFG